ncbi:MAG: phosphatase PAP2 family protein [Spirochaetaceae bacterium]|nr:phosphatase PAP2 family protein [Spirochaetaceae bacterium]
MKKIEIKRIIIVLSIFIFFIASPLFSESVYSLDLKTDIALLSISAAMFVPVLFISPDPDSTISKDEINFLDRQFIYPYNKTLDTISTVAVGTTIALPMLPVFQNIKDLNILGTYGIMYIEAFLLTTAVRDIFKLSVSRNRPYTYEGDIPSGKKDDYYKSFFSGHTCYAFLGATFFATTFSKDYPDSKWKTPLIISGYTVATTVGALRIASGSHFVTDVLAGAFVGSFYGWFIPNLHIKSNNKDSSVLVTPVGNSLLFSISY